jgi:cyanophycinase
MSFKPPIQYLFVMAKDYQYLAIGGGMELSASNPLVQLFIEKSGGKSGKITVLPTASDYGRKVGDLYTEMFSELCDDVMPYLIEKRTDAERPDLLRRLEDSTGIFFTGGDQLKITSLLGGSSVMKFLIKAKNNGVFIAGTSAGASAMPETMISWGVADTILKGNLQMSPGMGLVRNMVIDSHFIKRGRISRLFNLVAQNPGKLGVGLAEDTGILIDSSSDRPHFKVVGKRQVTIVDGSEVDHTNIASVREGHPFSITNVRVHLLGHGYEYHCLTKSITIPEKSELSDEVVSVEVYDLPYKPNEF